MIGGQQLAARRRRRDRLATVLITSAGFAVMALLLLMLGYLLHTALPLAAAPRIDEPRVSAAAATAALPADARAAGERPQLRRDGRLRCGDDGPWWPLPGLRGEPRLLALAEGGGTLLLTDTLGTLYRYGIAAPGDCRPQRLGEARPQPFVARALLAEARRPVAFLIAAGGRLRVLQSLTGEVLYDGVLPGAEGASRFALDAAGTLLSARRGEQLLRWRIHNPYPETGIAALWQAQWYPGYPAPAQVWHPDGEAAGTLSKYGLTPLLFGTFKAALCGMLIAVPLALGAAIYTGYFLSRRQRNRIKPAVELLEAFPTVVLGFLAGLWLAPLLADHLVQVVLVPLLLVLLPLLLALAHLLLQYLSPRFILRPPRASILVLAYLLALPALWWAGPGIEALFFDGSLRDSLLRAAGLRYEQRNALLVGLAMGVALVPTLFSIVEDAVFAVPRELSDGSLALGATRWQSLSRVVLPAASPAILSAMLIGLGRGLGETMIVLLATGNTPIMEYSPLLGLRSLSASLATELPEAAVGSTQFRVLFLAALVLFALTFVLNTVAELFRQQLRYRYAGR